jgi:3-oxoadipate enol-lactonase
MRIETNGIRLHYRVSGKGPWVTLSHALACDLSMWDAQIAALDAHYSVLRYDARGHGASDVPPGPYRFEQFADDVIGMWDTLGIERSHFVGLSMGGMIGQHLALRAPRRIDRLVLADTSSRYPADVLPVWAERIRVVREQGMEPMIVPTLERWFTAPYRAAHPDVMERIGSLIRSTPVEGYIACCHCIPRLDVTERLRQLRLPVLVIVGDQDAGTPPAMAEEIAAAIPGARIERIAEGAHLTNIEQAAGFNRLLLEFLAGPA